MPRPFRPIKLIMGARTNPGGKEAQADLRRQLNLLEKNFRMLAEHMTEESVQIVLDALRPTFNKSQEIVPKDTLALMKSGYLKAVRDRKGRVQAEIGYAYRGYPFYAVFVHEMPIPHKPPTQWKYLEQPLKEDMEDIRRRLAAGLKIAGGASV